jgi:tetratricopeptide (TPR) repeat protein
MADEDDNAASRGVKPDAAAEAIALSGASRARADGYLEVQTRLARLQSQNLVELNAFELSHLKWRRFNDQMRGFLQVLAFIVAASIVAGLGIVVWNAAHEDGLVIEAFSVPPDMVSRGLTGQAVAAQLQDRLSAMQAATQSGRPSQSYSNNWGNDIKVEIPDTGVSVGEFYRMLVATLGHESHITGEVWRGAKGLSVTAHVGGGGGTTVTGAEADFDALMQKAAEAVYLRTQPYRYAAFLGTTEHPQLVRERAILNDLAVNGSPEDRVWSHVGLGVDDGLDGDVDGALAEFHRAVALDPDLALPWLDLQSTESRLSHEEAELAYLPTAIRLLQENGDDQTNRPARVVYVPYLKGELASRFGDFAEALARHREATTKPDANHVVESALVASALDLARLHDGVAARRARADLPSNPAGVRAFGAIRRIHMSYWLGEYAMLAARHGEMEKALVADLVTIGNGERSVRIILSRQIWPFVAMAMAKSGDAKGAHALIDRTPTDCDTCLRARGVVDAADGNWRGADYWFARAVAHSPSVPFGDTDWGAMLLVKGDLDGAIAKFASANKKGPHFADPLEMWGEALIAKNRSDLALARFEEASKYDPNWGRLHLKWGEALFYAGKREDARKQFADASGLDLTVSEKSELAKVSHG